MQEANSTYVLNYKFLHGAKSEDVMSVGINSEGVITAGCKE